MALGGIFQRSSGREGVRPGFLGGKDGGESPAGLSKDDKEKKQNEVADGLQSFEDDAAGEGFYNSEDTLSSVRQNEERARGFYSGRGLGAAAFLKGKNEKQKGIKGKIKKVAPITAIMLLIMGTGGLMMQVLVFGPFSVVEVLRERFNTMQTSASVRSNVFFNKQMNKGRVKNPIKTKLFGSDTFKLSKRQIQKLADQGIEYDDDYNGARVLKYYDDAGDVRIVTADEKFAKSLQAEGVNAVYFRDAYGNDNDFSRMYYNGSKTWRGAIANWFNKMTAKFLDSNNLTRNMFKDYINRVNDLDYSGRKQVALEIIDERVRDIEDGGVQTSETKRKVDEDGNEVDPANATHPSDYLETEVDSDGSTKYALDVNTAEKGTISRLKSEGEVKAKLNDFADKYSGGKIGAAGKVANFSCLAVNFIGGVSLLAFASMASQIIQLTTSTFEAVDKNKDGDGDGSPFDVFAEAMNEKVKNKHVSLEYSGEAVVAGDMQANINESNESIKTLKTVETETESTAIQAGGIVNAYTGEKVNQNDPSVKNFNLTSSFGLVLGGIGTSMSAFKGCAFSRIATNAISAAADTASIIGCIIGALGTPVSGGASLAACGALIANIGMGIAISVGIGVLIASIITTITPVVANMMTKDLIKGIGGEDYGNALASGANMYQGGVHRANGGSLANREEYTEFAVAQKQIIAENARNERLTRSPFDLRSGYTFLGTILTEFMKLNTSNSLMSTLTSGSSMVNSSIVAMMPTASAVEVEQAFPYTDEEWEQTCPYLASIGAVGDAFCNPLAITDMSTIGMDPADVIDHLNDNFEDGTPENENVRIKGDSDLAKYIVFCDNRNSAFGIADQNIVNQVTNFATVNTGSAMFNNVTNSAIGAIPAVGDVIDIVNNSKALANAGYVGGESCVAGNTDSSASSPDWETAKYYQRFIEDQSLAETMGLIDESAVAVFLDEYYKENPLDNTYEGILSRMTGIEKEDVISLLEIIDFGVYLANYDPTTRYQFDDDLENEPKIFFEQDSKIASMPGIMNFVIIYNDVRNRTFAV